jgi:hypothetical protein
METNFQGLSGVGRGVYNPCFLTESLMMAHVMHDPIYLLAFYQNFGKFLPIKSNSTILSLFYLCQSALPPNCNAPPKSTFHDRLKEDIDDQDGIDPRGETLKFSYIFPMSYM